MIATALLAFTIGTFRHIENSAPAEIGSIEFSPVGSGSGAFYTSAAVTLGILETTAYFAEAVIASRVIATYEDSDEMEGFNGTVIDAGPGSANGTTGLNETSPFVGAAPGAHAATVFQLRSSLGGTSWSSDNNEPVRVRSRAGALRRRDANVVPGRDRLRWKGGPAEGEKRVPSAAGSWNDDDDDADGADADDVAQDAQGGIFGERVLHRAQRKRRRAAAASSAEESLSRGREGETGAGLRPTARLSLAKPDRPAPRFLWITLPSCILAHAYAAVILAATFLTWRAVHRSASNSSASCLETSPLQMRVVFTGITSAWTLSATAITVTMLSIGIDLWIEGVEDPGRWGDRTFWAVSAVLPTLAWRLFLLFSRNQGGRDDDEHLYVPGGGPTGFAVFAQAMYLWQVLFLNARLDGRIGVGGEVDWSWWITLSPFWIAAILTVIVLLIASCAALSDGDEARENRRIMVGVTISILVFAAAVVVVFSFAVVLVIELERAESIGNRARAARVLGPFLVAVAAVAWIATLAPVITGFVLATMEASSSRRRAEERAADEGGGNDVNVRPVGPRRTNAAEFGITWISAMPINRSIRVRPEMPPLSELPAAGAPAA